jgi:1,4-alpha-glucan branching enzyme
MFAGNYVLILHTHLPWVLNHGTWPHGEDWLTEAVAECYIPLLNVFNELVEKNILPKVTLDISPVLCEQLEHPDFKNKFINYCDEKIAAAKKDNQDFKAWGYDPHHIYLTDFWKNWYSDRKQDFIDKYDHSIVKSLKALQDSGAIEIMTCGATHGYFPLLATDESINLQVKLAVENYKKHFGREPKGIWLPECAYRPSYEWHSFIPVSPFNQSHLRQGVENIIARYGIKYFVTDQKLLENSYPLGKYVDESNETYMSIDDPGFKHTPWSFDRSPLRLYQVSSSDEVQYGTAAVFTRHRDISMQVWSGEVGYPGQPDYLDFHKKHLGSMLRYWRVTDNKADMMYKQLYHPDWTNEKVDLQANHFIHHIENTLNYNKNKTGIEAAVCTPFDTELFGHWWFEGPQFLKHVIEGMAKSPFVQTATAHEYYIKENAKDVIHLPEGSWGENNTHEVWINEQTKWTWEQIYNCELRFSKIMEKADLENINQLEHRILKQALRELLLMQASDWQFLIHTKGATDYAEQRFFYHNTDFNKLCDLYELFVKSKSLSQTELSYLLNVEKRNSLFEELNLKWWAK